MKKSDYLEKLAVAKVDYDEQFAAKVIKDISEKLASMEQEPPLYVSLDYEIEQTKVKKIRQKLTDLGWKVLKISHRCVSSRENQYKTVFTLE